MEKRRRRRGNPNQSPKFVAVGIPNESPNLEIPNLKALNLFRRFKIPNQSPNFEIPNLKSPKFF